MAQLEVNVHEAKTQLSKLLAKLDAGERVIIKRRGKRAVQLVHAVQERKLGWATGVVIHEDFDTLDPETAEAFGA
jgi:antitoxin (DNA-binding transcriptional repressor) of toxin-antitoxin stability system